MDGGVGVLLRVEHPHQQVGEHDEPVDLEVVADLGGVVVGQVHQHDAVELAVGAAGGARSRLVSSSESRIVWWRGGMPSHSSSSSAPVLPHTQAVAHDVVGRRTPVEESSRPVRALNVEDLPEPVAPAIATTVCSAESRSRPAARAATASASSSEGVVEAAAGGRGGGLEPLDARADVGAARDELAGAFEQGCHRSLSRAGSSAGRGRLVAQVVDAAGRLAQPLGRVGSQRQRVDPGKIAGALVGEQGGDAAARASGGRARRACARPGRRRRPRGASGRARPSRRPRRPRRR